MKNSTIKELNLNDIVNVAGGTTGGNNCRTVSSVICDGTGNGPRGCRTVSQVICD